VLYAQAKQKEAEDAAAELRRASHLASLGVDPATQLRQKLEVLQKELTRQQRAAKAAEVATTESRMSAAEKNRDSIQNLEQELSTTHAEVARLKRTATEQARELTSLRHRLNSASSPRAAAAAAAAAGTPSFDSNEGGGDNATTPTFSPFQTPIQTPRPRHHRRSATNGLVSAQPELPSFVGVSRTLSVHSDTTVSSSSSSTKGGPMVVVARNPMNKKKAVRLHPRQLKPPSPSTFSAPSSPSPSTGSKQKHSPAVKPASPSLPPPPTSGRSLSQPPPPSSSRSSRHGSTTRTMTPSSHSSSPLSALSAFDLHAVGRSNGDLMMTSLGPPSVAQAPTSKAAGTSKTNQKDRREQQKQARLKQAREEGAAEAGRTAGSLSEVEKDELRDLGFFAPSPSSSPPLTSIASSEGASSAGNTSSSSSPSSPLPLSPSSLAEALLSARKEVSRGVRSKGTTVTGAEASLSQSLAEVRMQEVERFMEHCFDISGGDNDARGRKEEAASSASLCFSLELKQHLCGALKKLDTRIERGHAVLVLLNSLHRCRPITRDDDDDDDDDLGVGSSHTLAAVCFEAAVAPGGSFWDAQGGVKLGTAVALRASDHCRVAVAGAKAALLVRRLRRTRNREEDAEEAKAALAVLLSDTVRIVADTEARRGAVGSLFGDASVDARTANAEAMLEAAVSKGTAAMHETQQAISECLRLVTVEGLRGGGGGESY